MRSLVILHTNDIHGHIDGLARVAGLVEHLRATLAHMPVLYVDAGDCEDAADLWSHVTKGAVMHQLLSAATCDAAVVGNAALVRYGPGALKSHSYAAHYPLLLGNLRSETAARLEGSRPATRITVGDVHVGLIGVTAYMPAYTSLFGLDSLAIVPLVRQLAAELRDQGAEMIILLSHLGLECDRSVAAELQQDVTLIVGAHSHNLLAHGEWVGQVLIVQAGKYAEALGQVRLADIDGRWRVMHAEVLPVAQHVPPTASVMAAFAAFQAQIEPFMAESVGELLHPLSFAVSNECDVANLAADTLRWYMKADIGVVTAGQAFRGPLPAGQLRRATLWRNCWSCAKPGIVMLRGWQLEMLIQRGLDLSAAEARPPILRGQERGLLHISGATFDHGRLEIDGRPVDRQRIYSVAGSDWEFDVRNGYVDLAWDVRPSYDRSTILPEALEAYLRANRPLRQLSRRTK